MSEKKEEIKENMKKTSEGKEIIKENNENTIEENKDNSQNTIKQELEDTTDRLKRVMAEFENYKKRNSKEREMLYGSLVSDIISAFLPVMDNLEKAVESKTEDEIYKQGIDLVLKQFKDVLKNFGVETIKTVGEPFDPEIHEAVSSVQDDALDEKIVKEEFRKGYKIGTKVIRHAMVVVAN